MYKMVKRIFTRHFADKNNQGEVGMRVMQSLLKFKKDYVLIKNLKLQ